MQTRARLLRTDVSIPSEFSVRSIFADRRHRADLTVVRGDRLRIIERAVAWNVRFRT